MVSTKFTSGNQSEFSQIEGVTDFTIGFEKSCLAVADQT
jgi:hypothetical protein